MSVQIRPELIAERVLSVRIHGGVGTPAPGRRNCMISMSRSRVRALALVGTAGVVAALGLVASPASAAEVAEGATLGADARRIDVPRIASAIRPPAGSRPVGAYVVARGT